MNIKYNSKACVFARRNGTVKMQDSHQGLYLGPFIAGLKTVSLPGDVRNEPPLRFKELFGGLVDGVDHNLWAGCKII